MRVAVIGGGVAGLASALALRDRGHEVIVLEADRVVGGKVRTEKRGPWRVELGPAALAEEAPATQGLLHRLRLDSDVILSEEEARHRFVLRNGRLREVPQSPPKLVLSRVLSLSAKLRLLGEPRVAPRPLEVEETVADFARRRFGAEIAERLVEPMVTGVFAGDYERLSVDASFPKVVELERRHGSIIRALIANERARRVSGAPRKRSHLLTLKGGLGRLPLALHEVLGSSVKLSAPALALCRVESSWQLNAGGETVVADRVLIALPASKAAPLLMKVDESMGTALNRITEVGIACVSLGFRRTDLARLPVGFGFLIPKREGRRLLGAIFMSDTFPTAPQAPTGHALIRCMLGGARDPAALDLDDEQLVGLARADLERTVDLSVPPQFSHVVRWRSAIAQYELGHADRLSHLEARGRALGIGFAGAAFYGIGVNDVIADALPAVERLLAH